MLRTIVGMQAQARSTTDSFVTTLVDAFFNVLIPILADSTRDIGDFARIGRSLWPLYIEPLSKANMEATLSALKREGDPELGTES